MADAGRHRTQRLAVVVVIGVNDGDGHLGALLDDEFPHAHELIGAQGELRIHLWPDRPVSVIPDVMHAAMDEFLEPLFGQEFVDI